MIERYRQSMSSDVLRSWAQDAQDEIDTLETLLESTEQALATHMEILHEYRDQAEEGDI